MATHEPWIRAQIKAFTGWVNAQIMQRDPALKITDILTELADGTRLIVLLECLEGTVTRLRVASICSMAS